jgi:hypothetical protein
VFDLCGINNQILIKVFMIPFEVGTLSKSELDSRTYLKNLQLDLNFFLHLHNGYVF